LSFPVTGTFTDWKAVDVSLTLIKGINVIKLISATAEGLANIDQIGYVSTGVSSGSCVVTGLEDTNEGQQLSIYPNPSKGAISWNADRKWQLIDVYGFILMQGEGHSLDLAAYAKGVYMLKFEKGITVKVIKD